MAQITPDATLGAEKSIVQSGTIVQGQQADLIEGGATRGSNLFHSFAEFNVDSSQRVLFASPSGIKNILSRVTGANPSNIQGILGVDGGANLFFLNPNGIIFGPDAQLSVQGSFLATTADSFIFKNGLKFSAISPEPPPLLVVNLPVGLQFGKNQGRILSQSFPGLEVPAGKTLALVGGPVLIEGGSLTAPKGRIEIGSVGDSSFVSLSPNEQGLVLGYEGVQNFQNIELNPRTIIFGESEFKSVATIDAEGGDVQLQGRRVILTGGSQILTKSGGNLTVNASESVELTGSNTFEIPLPPFSIIAPSALFSGTDNDGNAGNLTITTKRLLVQGGLISVESSGAVVDGGKVITATGNAGNLTINASESVELNGNDSQLTTSTQGPGNAGDISITTDKLFLSQGGEIIASTNPPPKDDAGAITSKIGDAGDISIITDKLFLSDGGKIIASTTSSGDAGNISIQANKLVNLSGSNSGLFSNTEENNGKGGDIFVRTNKFQISDNATVDVSTTADGIGGNIFIQSDSFLASDGGQIISTTKGSKSAGDITLKVLDSITLDGNGSGLFANSTSSLSGSGGNINIDPKVMFIQNEAKISVDSRSNNSAGKIDLRAGNLTLDRGTISATSTSGKGGDIDLFIDNLLLLKNSSEISASTVNPNSKNNDTNSAGNIDLRAGNLTLDRSKISATSTSSKGGNIDLLIDNLLLLKNNSSISASSKSKNLEGNGGNINITTDLLVVLENSEIIANALAGEGGDIDINTRGLFISPDSKIDASSELGVDGVVEINNRETDPINSVSELPEVVEPPQEVAKGCRPGQALGNSTFVNVGRGGLPPGPQEVQTPSAVWQDLRAHNLQDQTSPASTSKTDSTSLALDPPSTAILEAQRWTKDDQGRIYLTTTVPQPSQSSLQPTAAC
ncbi:MAG: filamentous hemagglutinin N-terminal domain-containing protein [Acaryochloris sp. RU_4_1]|nr:filamentous hemagglutinin N-terminal domain-containing protein [Acaryochloris sp. RU_4_1]